MRCDLGLSDSTCLTLEASSFLSYKTLIRLKYRYFHCQPTSLPPRPTKMNPRGYYVPQYRDQYYQ